MRPAQTSSPTSPPRSKADLVAEVTASGPLPPSWAATFTAIDRGRFIPAQCWVDDHNGRPRPLDRHQDPARWAEAVYSDVPIVTQLDDGHTAWPATSRNATSSASQPSMVLTMLDALDVAADDPFGDGGGLRVLEVGTGTGYNAALLAHRLGDYNVTTVEVDPDLTDTARAALHAAGYDPTVVCGDGTRGHPANAPYDRILSTASVLAGRLPTAWLTQTRPGATIVTPWKTVWGTGALLRLDRDDATTGEDTATATGRVIGDAYFMNLRDHRTPFGHAGRFGRAAEHATDVPTTTTTVFPYEVAIDDDGAFTVGLLLHDTQRSIAYDPADPSRQTYELLLYDVTTDSWATVQIDPDTTAAGAWPVRQHGPRKLWTEAETAHHWWTTHARPARSRFGVAVTTEHQIIWLDDTDNTLSSATA